MNCLTDRDETAYDTAKHTVKIVITRKLNCGWETRATRQHSKFTQKKSIETMMMFQFYVA